MKQRTVISLSLALVLSGCPLVNPVGTKDTGKKTGSVSTDKKKSNGGAGTTASDLVRSIAQNGTPTELIGKVKLISDKGLGIVSNNTGNLISNNGGGLISDKGLGVVSNGGLNFRTLASSAPQESLLADATIEVVDAAGRVLVDENNLPLTATSDKQGNYSFKAVIPPETLVMRVKLFPNGGAAGAGGQLSAIVPKSQTTSARTLPIDTASSLATTYVLEMYVKKDQAVLNKLPDLEAETLQREMEAARLHMATAVPSYKPEELVKAAEDLRGKAPALDAALDRIEAILLAGQANLGNGLKATQAPLANPHAVTGDDQGNLYIAETSAGRIRKVTPDGTISTYVGPGATGWPAGADPILTTGWDLIANLAFGPDGALYVVEGYSSRVRKITKDGKVINIAGNGKRAVGAVNVPATSTSLNYPVGLGFGKDGSIYIGETVDQDRVGQPTRLLKVRPDGILTEIPAPDPVDSDYTAVLEGSDGALYLLEARGDIMYRQRPQGEWEHVTAELSMSYQSRMLLKADGHAIVTNSPSHKVVDVAPDGTVKVIAGGGTGDDGGLATDAVLNSPAGVWLGKDGTLFISEAGAGTVRAIGPDGKIRTVAGTRGATQVGDATSIAINQPGGVVIDPQGRIVFSEVASGTLKRLENGKLTIIGGSVSGFSGDGGPATAAQFSKPAGLAYSGEVLFVVDAGNNRVRKIDGNGVVQTIAGNDSDVWLGQAKLPPLEAQMHSASGIAISPEGLPYWTDAFFNNIARIAPDGQWELVAGALDATSGDTGDGKAASNAKLNRPLGLVFDREGTLYVGDGGNFRIRKIAKDGTISHFAGLPTFTQNLQQLMSTQGKATDGESATNSPIVVPTSIVFDAAGNLFVAELGTQGLASFADVKDVPLDLLPKVPARIRKITPDGKIYTVAGPGTKLLNESFGDNSLRLPIGLAFDKHGRLVVTDSGTNQLKLLPKEAL